MLYSDQSDEEQLADFLDEPPLEVAARVYSVDEVKRSARIRDTVRRVEIGDITFDTGEATVERDQVGSLTTVAAAMKRLIDRNPSEVFLIEGHTDAVGSDESNLELSDRRAETIADLLVDFYDIPPENLTTQGYGEEYLKVLTEGPERANRRATVRRITPLVSSAESDLSRHAEPSDGGPGVRSGPFAVGERATDRGYGWDRLATNDGRDGTD